jgi:hypothetical protein
MERQERAQGANRESERVQETERRLGARPVKARNRNSRSKSPRKVPKREGGKNMNIGKQVRVQLLQLSRLKYQPGVLW